MLSKSLIQFSVYGRCSVPSLLSDLSPIYGGCNEDMATSFKRSHARTAALSAPDPAAGHHLPTPLPETPGHSWTSLGQSLVGSLLLSPGLHKVLFVLSKSLFPLCYVSPGGLWWG